MLVETRRFEEGIALLTRCVADAERVGDPRLALTARGRFAVALGEQRDSAQAIAVLAEAEAGWVALGDLLEAARARVRRANLLQRSGRIQEALPLLEAGGAELVALGDEASAVTAFAVISLVRANHLELDPALEAATRAVALVRRAGLLQREGYTLMILATVHRLRDECDLALAVIDEAATLAEELRDGRLRASVRFERAHVLHQVGDRAALEAAIAAAAANAAIGNFRMEANVWLLVARIELDRDALDGAWTATDRAAAHFGEIEDLGGMLEIAFFRGMITAERGEDATGYLREAEGWLARMGTAEGLFLERIADLRAKIEG